MIKISPHISYEEATKSYTAAKHGIDNTPCRKQLRKMKRVAEEVFEPVRIYFDTPIAVVSFYRSKKLNKRIGGAKGSQHVKGKAIDMDAHVYGGITNKQIFDFIYTYLEFDQLIAEYPDKNKEPQWVHVSYSSDNRNETLVAYKRKGKTRFKYYEA